MAGTVLMVGSMGACSLLALSLAVGGGAAAASQRMAAAADSAALAAADTVSGALAGIACERAEELARAHGTTVVSCEIVMLIATVEVRGEYAGIEVRARARAGPQQ